MKGRRQCRLAGSMFATAAVLFSGAASAQDTGGAPDEQTQAGTQSSPGSQGVAATDQSSRADNQGRPGDIVVTANRREERLNDIATAVSAFTAEDRTIRGINSTQDVARFTPGVSISDNPNRVNIRGVGRVTNALGSDPGVANYVDGFYTSESDVIGASDFLTERVEILRGPQGTLYGRNAIGGATNIISKRPTADFVVEGRASINDYNRYQGAASLSGPISDRIRFRVAAIGAKQDGGYVRNLTGPDQYSDEIYTVEGQLEFDLTSNLNAWFRLAHTRYDQRPQAPTTISSFAGDAYFGGLVPNPQFGFTNASEGRPYTVAYDFGGREQLSDNLTAVTNITLDTDEVTVRFIGGYAQYEYLQERDLDQTNRQSYIRATPFGPTRVYTNFVERVGEDKDWYSGELNFLSTPGGDFDWLIGIYGYGEKLDQPVDFTVPDEARLQRPCTTPVPNCAVAFENPRRSYYSQRGQLSSTALAAFSQATWRFAEGLSAELGLRYSVDQKRGTEQQRQVFLNYDLLPVIPGVVSIPSLRVRDAIRSLRGEWEAWSGNFGVNFEPTDDTLLYGKISRGYKSGGFSLGALAPVPEVDAEKVDAYEIGLKQTFGPIQINTAAFLNNYRNQQVPTQFDTGNNVLVTILSNVPKSRTYGFEAEANAQVASPLRLAVIYSYLNAKFREFAPQRDPALPATAPFIDLEGENLPQSPRHRLTLNGLLTAGPFDFSATQSFVGSQYYQIFNDPRYRAPSYEDTTLQLTYSAPGERFRLIGRVSNVFDNTSYSFVTANSAANGGLQSVIPRIGRLFTLEGRVKF